MDALAARALLFERKLQELPVEFSIVGAEALDGQLSIMEVKGLDTTNAQKLATTPDGTDDMLMGAAMICKALVMRDTKQRVFSDNDVEAVAAMGLTVINPLGNLVKKASGMSVTAVEEAKKNSSTTPESGSNTSSLTESEGTPTQS